MSKLAAGDVVSARKNLAFKGGVVPTGRRGVVESVEAAERGPVFHTRFPVVVSGLRRIITIAASHAEVTLECPSDEVLRDPAHRTTPSKKNAWAALQKDELISLGARLRQEAIVASPHVYAGWIVAAKICGRIVGCVEVPGVSVTYIVNVTLADPDHHQGHRFTNVNLSRDDFDVVDPDLAEGLHAAARMPR